VALPAVRALLGTSYSAFIHVSSDRATVSRMQKPPAGRPRPVLARDAALRRLRRATQVSVAVMVAVGGTFAALAAGATHAKKTVVRSPVRARKVVSLMQAPAPPLVAAQSAAPAASAAPPAAPAPPVAAPTQSYSPPVVVSGGS
jgi:hypothetical protein